MDYAPYLQKAFRQAVRDILADAARDGLAGDSHFLITFQTDRDDVRMPAFVRAKYPSEISIVLQNQFSNLSAGPESFSVDVSFGGVSSHLVVPYAAITAFADPSTQFGLMLTPERPAAPKAQVIDLAKHRKA
ncbi:MAG: ClpXP protease specificity-enhancing factor SspB [Alphaproteobacteria bacterium]|nr:ClpXP protease specificity-enhancing factor SspB [Alphaproteobacteria bacterium]